MRHRTFSRWHDKSGLKQEIKMQTLEISVGDSTHYLGFICHRTNKRIDQLTKEFESIAHRMVDPGKK